MPSCVVSAVVYQRVELGMKLDVEVIIMIVMMIIVIVIIIALPAQKKSRFGFI